MMQRGGTLLGEGSFGCAFTPALPCEDGRKFEADDIVKIVVKGTEADEELKTGRAIMAISSLSSNYFALPKESCTPLMPIQDPDASQCELLEEGEEVGEGVKGQGKGQGKDEGKSYNMFSMLIMPNAGITLYDWSHKYPVVADNFQRVIKHLLEGMVIFQDPGYIHNDIKDNNILVDKHNVPRYIDFGLAYKAKDVTTMSSANLGTVFKPRFRFHPPEIHVWRILFSNSRASMNSIDDIIADGVNQLKKHNSLYEQLENAFPNRDSAKIALTRYAKDTYALWVAKDFGTIVQRYGLKFDTWRLGVTLWNIWYSLLKWQGFQNHPISKKAAAIKALIGGLTDFDVEKRWDAKQALKKYEPTPNQVVAV